MLVIACNTATALALDKIALSSAVPVIGVIEPGAASASAASQTRNVVVIGTEATISSHAYAKALQARGVQAKEKACPLLVPLVEEGWSDHAVTEQVARVYLDEAFADGSESADVLVAGMHPLSTAQAVVAPTSSISCDNRGFGGFNRAGGQPVVASRPAESVGREEERRGMPRLKFFVTDSAEKFQRLGARFLGGLIEEVEHVELKE